MTPGNGQVPNIVAKIEIVLFEDGRFGCQMQVRSRYEFNAMMETGKQQMLAELMQTEQQKVKLPSVDVSRLNLKG